MEDADGPAGIAGEIEHTRMLGTIREYAGMRDQTGWENISIGGSITSNPVAYNGNIYFSSYDKNFYALDSEGNEKWRFPTNGVIQADALCKDGRVYFGSGDRCIYCLDAETGELIWKFETRGAIGCAPAEHDGVLYACSTDGNLYAITESGKLLWVFKTSYPLMTPLVKDRRIYLGYEGSCVYCLDLKGRMLWKFNVNAWVAGWPPAAGNDSIYFGSADGNFYAISADGSLKWKYAAGNITLSPVAEEGRVYFGCFDGKGYCLDSEGRIIWTFKAEETVSEIALDDKTAYIASYDKRLYAADKNTGKLLWSFKTNGIIQCRPLVHESKVIFGSWDCNLYCLDKHTGKLLWKFRTSMSTPSELLPPENVEIVKLEFAPQAEEKQDSKVYKNESSSDYDIERTTYSSGMSKTYISGKKKGYVSSSEF